MNYYYYFEQLFDGIQQMESDLNKEIESLNRYKQQKGYNKIVFEARQARVQKAFESLKKLHEFLVLLEQNIKAEIRSSFHDGMTEQKRRSEKKSRLIDRENLPKEAKRSYSIAMAFKTWDL